MLTNISVEFKVPKYAYTALQLIASQNKQVLLVLNDDGTIILAAQMRDMNDLDD